MIPADLLEVLRCPETRQPVTPADVALVAAINGQIATGQLRNRVGKILTEPMEEALLRADGEFLYPVRGGIPIMLLDEAVPAPAR